MAAANEIQRSLEALAIQAGRAERRARQAQFAPNLLLKNPRGFYDHREAERAPGGFRLRVDWEVHNLGEGPAQDLEAGAANSIDQDISRLSFAPVTELAGRPLTKGETCWATVTFAAEASELWYRFLQETGVEFERGLTAIPIHRLSEFGGSRPTIFVKCKDVFGSESVFCADLAGNMRLVNTPLGGGA